MVHLKSVDVYQIVGVKNNEISGLLIAHFGYLSGINLHIMSSNRENP